MEQQEVIYVGAEDRTDRGYNSSMNFWYVGGEVVFSSETITLPEELSFLEMDVKSPVTDPVDVRLRVYPEGEEEVLLEAGSAEVKGNTIQVDLSDFAGKTVRWETVYVWEQSSLITIRPEAPASRIVNGAAALAESETAVEAETGTVTYPETETNLKIENHNTEKRPGIFPVILLIAALVGAACAAAWRGKERKAMKKAREEKEKETER